MVKRIHCLLICVSVLFLMSSCGICVPQKETLQEPKSISIVFSEAFLESMDCSAERWIDFLRETFADMPMELHISEDGISVTWVIKDTELSDWRASIKREAEKLKEEFAEIEQNYRLEFSNDFTSIDIYIDQSAVLFSVADCLFYSNIYCIMFQALDGTDPESWELYINMYNCETGKLVTSGDRHTGVSSTPSDWDASRK